jgi:hypothetical protein
MDPFLFDIMIHGESIFLYMIMCSPGVFLTVLPPNTPSTSSFCVFRLDEDCPDDLVESVLGTWFKEDPICPASFGELSTSQVPVKTLTVELHPGHYDVGDDEVKLTVKFMKSYFI